MSKSNIFYLKLSLAVILCILFGAFLLLQGRQKSGGIVIRPEKEYDSVETVYNLQYDPLWQENNLGNSPYTMKSSGCLTAAIASSLAMQEMPTDREEILDAGELNQLFSREEVYNGAGDIVWGNIKNALEDTEVYVAGSVSRDEINQLLEEGKYPLVKVKIPKNGAVHWVVITGAGKDSYLCMDPMNRDRTEVPLSDFNNAVYALRCVYWVDAQEDTAGGR